MAVRTGWALETDAWVQIWLWPLTNYDLECCASVSLTVKWANNSPPNPGYGAEVCVCGSCSTAGPLAVGVVGASPIKASQAHVYAAQDCCACSVFPAASVVSVVRPHLSLAHVVIGEEPLPVLRLLGPRCLSEAQAPRAQTGI